MTPTQRAAAERLADELQRFDGAERESLRDEAAALLRELTAEPVHGASSDVAWLWTHCRALGMTKRSDSHSLRDDVALFICTLYDAAPQQRRPLSDERMKEIMSDAGIRVFQPGLWGVLIEAGQAVERAHGITGEPT